MLKSHLDFCLLQNKIKVTPGRCLTYNLFKIHDNGGFESFWDHLFYWLTVLAYRKLSWRFTCIFFLQLKLASHLILTQISKTFFFFFYLCLHRLPRILTWTKYQYVELFLAGSRSPVLCILCLLFSRPSIVYVNLSCTNAKTRHSV